jgi:uncharacterized protein YbjT (DUF2867 family)
MQHPRILVTGASGKTGGAVAMQLLAEGWPVRALVHRHDPRSAALAQAGAEVVVADLHDPDRLLAALRGTRRAYYVPPFAPHAVHAAAAFAWAAREAGLEAVVQMSQWLSSPRHPAVLTRETWLVDRLLSGLPGVAHVQLNPGMFADNFLRVVDMAALLGVYPVLTAASRSAPVATEDIARCAVALLKDPQAHAGRRYRPTGPRLLSGEEIAAILGRVVGRRVHAVSTPFWLFNKAARWSGASIHEVYNYREYLRDHRDGAFSVGGGVTDVVEQLTGSPAEDFETTARRYAALPFARGGALRRLTAAIRFAALPLLPGHDLARHEREHRFPRPARTVLASADADWLDDHVPRGPEAGRGAPRPAHPALAPQSPSVMQDRSHARA